ncbi:MAG TPA: galactokinase [Solirubrobacteraceae bacterium]
MRVRAPGRVNLIGEHTDYNDGLCLPFAIEAGITVTAERLEQPRVEAEAADLGERDAFSLDDIGRADGWRAFVRGVAGELQAAGHALSGARLRIEADLPQGSGLSSSAALEAGVALALLALAGELEPDRIALAKLCSRVENEWVGAQTGLLDQLAVLLAEPGAATRLDMRTLQATPVPLELGDWRLVVLDSGAEHSNASGGYNQRRAECTAAAEALGVASLRDATVEGAARLPDPLDRRVRHVLTENARVEATIAALRAGDLEAVGEHLDASHVSLRDDYDASVAEVEATVTRLHAAGAAGARMVGGGFGGSVLALFPPGAEPPPEAVVVRPGPPARIVT